MHRLARLAAAVVTVATAPALADALHRPPAAPVFLVQPGATPNGATIVQAMPDGPPIPIGTIDPTRGTFVPKGALPLTGGVLQNPAPKTVDATDFAFVRDERGLAGGTVGYVNTPVRSTCFSGPAVTSFLWCGIDVLHNYATAGENTSRYVQAFRHSGAGPTFALVNEVIDTDIAGNPTQGVVAQEADIRGDGPDVYNSRIGLNIFATRQQFGPQTSDPDMVAGYGVKLNNYDTDHESFNFGFSMGNAKANWAFDCHGAKILSGCLYMAEGQTIEMSATADRGLLYQGGNFVFRRAGVPVFKIGDNGVVENDSNPAGEATFRALDTTGGIDTRITSLPGAGGIVGTYSNHDLTVYANNGPRASFKASGGVVLGGNGAAVVKGQVALVEATSTPSPPGAGYASLTVVPGTTPGSCRLILYGGTGTTPVTIVDNVGAGC